MNKNIADYINIVSDFCGKRDIDFLTREELYKKYNINKADVMVLFGGSIIAGGDILADAIKNNIADKYIIVGGAGHTTDSLRVQMRKELPNILIDDKITEAEMFNNYIANEYATNPNVRLGLVNLNDTFGDAGWWESWIGDTAMISNKEIQTVVKIVNKIMTQAAIEDAPKRKQEFLDRLDKILNRDGNFDWNNILLQNS